MTKYQSPERSGFADQRCARYWIFRRQIWRESFRQIADINNLTFGIQALQCGSWRAREVDSTVAVIPDDHGILLSFGERTCGFGRMGRVSALQAVDL